MDYKPDCWLADYEDSTRTLDLAKATITDWGNEISDSPPRYQKTASRTSQGQRGLFSYTQLPCELRVLVLEYFMPAKGFSLFEVSISNRVWRDMFSLHSTRPIMTVCKSMRHEALELLARRCYFQFSHNSIFKTIQSLTTMPSVMRRNIKVLRLYYSHDTMLGSAFLEVLSRMLSHIDRLRFLHLHVPFTWYAEETLLQWVRDLPELTNGVIKSVQLDMFIGGIIQKILYWELNEEQFNADRSKMA